MASKNRYDEIVKLRQSQEKTQNTSEVHSTQQTKEQIRNWRAIPSFLNSISARGRDTDFSYGRDTDFSYGRDTVFSYGTDTDFSYGRDACMSPNPPTDSTSDYALPEQFDNDEPN